LLAAGFEVLGFELAVFVIRLAEMVGGDERIATPETAKCLLLLGQIACHPHQRHEQQPGTTAADECD